MDTSSQISRLSRTGDVGGLTDLLAQGHDINDRGIAPSHFSLKWDTFNKGNYEFLIKMLEAGLSLDKLDISDFQVFNDKTLKCLTELLFFKVYQDALKTCSNKSLRTLLDAAFHKDFDTVVKYKFSKSKSKIKKGAPTTNDKNKNEILSVLLYLLIRHNDCPTEILQTLIDSGADVNTSFHDYTACVYAVLCANLNALDLLINNNCSLDSVLPRYYSYCPTAFHFAIFDSNLDCLSRLLQVDNLKRMQVWKDKGYSLLKFAIGMQQKDIVIALLNFGVSPQKPTGKKQKKPPIAYAVMQDDLTILETLLTWGADVNVRGEYSETPLMFAVEKDKPEFLDMLVAYGADIDAVNFENYSSIVYSAQWGSLKCFKRLLSLGANLITNINGRKFNRVLDYSMGLKRREFLEILLASGKLWSDDHSLNDCNKDSFLYGVRQYNIQALLSLLENGIFSWKWLDDIPQLRTEVLAKVLVSSGIPPGHFTYKGSTTTLLQSALAAHDTWTAHYLIANLYLSEYDLEYLRTRTEFLANLFQNSTVGITEILNALVANPLPLQTLSVVSLIKSFLYQFDKNTKPANLREVVESFPIPTKFKSVLTFRTEYSKVCTNKWHQLGQEMGKSKHGIFLFPFQMFAFSEDWCACRNGNAKRCCCSARSYRDRYDVLERMNYRKPHW